MRPLQKILILFGLVSLGIFIISKLYEEPPRLPVSLEEGGNNNSVQGSQNSTTEEVIPDVTIIAESLSIPWDIAFLPDGNFLVTERGGNLLEISSDGKTKTTIPLVHPVPKGEGGLLGIVLHPDFKNNRKLYLYMTTSAGKDGTKNAVFQYTFRNGKISDEKIIVKDIPGAIYHDGGRMEFGPDGMLYITTGDAQDPSIAQDLASLGGKILRVKDDGTLPDDNPYLSISRSRNAGFIYSYGHRNPQGLAWDSEGQLWETEHGRSGVTSGLDEINRIQKGFNYGWPTIEGDKTGGAMERPARHSGADVTWAPASLVYYDGSLFFGGLRGESLYEAVLENGAVKEVKSYFKGDYGRIRTVRIGPDGMFYLTTSNRDGRGDPAENDDVIVRINPKIFRK